MSGEYHQDEDARGVLPIPGMGPVPGDRYMNRHVLVYAVVVAVEQRRHCWVRVRSQGHEYEIRLDEFERFWELP